MRSIAKSPMQRIKHFQLLLRPTSFTIVGLCLDNAQVIPRTLRRLAPRKPLEPSKMQLQVKSKIKTSFKTVLLRVWDLLEVELNTLQGSITWRGTNHIEL